VCTERVIGTDFYSTFLSFAGKPQTSKGQDGLDLSPLLRSGKPLDRQALYWHYPHYSDQGGTPTGAILEGDWKLIEFFEDNHVELYNLALDEWEQYDLSSSFADRATDLRSKLAAWRSSVGAKMPRPNPSNSARLKTSHVGRQGCSWDPSPGCLTD
jgi:arylsulfatase A-like enzyme